MNRITLKFGNMRKSQDFSVYPFTNEDVKVTIQSATTIAQINPQTRELKYYTRSGGAYFAHLCLPGVKTIILPEEDWLKIKELITNRGITLEVNDKGTTIMSSDNNGFIKLI